MAPIKTILYPTDFSGPSQYALGLACALARDQKARLIVLHIVPSPEQVTWGANIGEPNSAGRCQHDSTIIRVERRAKLDRLPLPSLAFPVERLLKAGDVSRVIVETARETKCDLIVMGSHGLAGAGWRLMGSVAAEVAQDAPCPVLYVKVPFEEPHPVDQSAREEVDVIP